MAKVIERRRAVELRKQGYSYSEIRQQIKVSKSSLSLWLRNYPLNEEQLKRIKSKKERQIEKYRETMRIKREKKLQKYYYEEKNKWFPISEKELYFAGLFLYWGEGNKSSRGSISLNNTDPGVVRFALYWLIYGLGIAKERIKVFVHLYDDMDVERELNYWAKMLGMKRTQFAKPYIKKSSRTEVDQKGYGHGTCGIRVHNTEMKDRLMMSLKAVSNFVTL